MDKRITTLTIKGLNTSMPDLTVPDGACEKLMNMRFRDGSWRNVGAVQMTENIPLPEDVVRRRNHFEFLGVHEVEGVNHYLGKGVIESEDDAGKVYDDLHLYVYIKGEWADLGVFASIYGSPTSFTEALSTDIRVTSFGNALIVSTENTTSYFIFSDGKYNIFRMPEPVKVNETTSVANPRKSYDYEDRGVQGEYFFFWDILNKDNGEIMLTDNVDYGWMGEICYLVAYRMKDGSILSPTNLRILCSEEDYYEANVNVYLREVDDEKYISLGFSTPHSYDLEEKLPFATSRRLRTFIPKLRITIPDVDTSLIDRVAIFSTRINPILDYEKLRKTNFRGRSGIPYYDFYSDNRLPEQPLYLVEEVDISSLEEGVWEVELSYDKFKNIGTQSIMYKAPQLHTIIANSLYDYNNRMHYGGVSSTIYAHTPSIEETQTIYAPNILYSEELISLDNGVSVYSKETIPNSDQRSEGGWVTNIISYHDYRATTLTLVSTRSDGKYGIESISLRPATANNIAYFIPEPTHYKYNRLFSPSGGFSTATKPVASPTLSEPNRIQVSAPNNPFSLPFQNSYTVGNEGSRVEALNTVADSLVDSNFYGAYPLYIFTTDGIFALRAGSGEVLYAGTEIINHDKINNPRTIALNGSVVYACSEGLKALTGRQAVRISADIDPLTWKEAQFGINWEYGELLCRMANGEVFVWNIAAGAWSQRDDVVGSLRGSYAGEVTSEGKLVVCDINKEDIEETEVMFVTRPLKFDSVGFKKLDTLIARIASSLPCNWTIKVESSNNCREWRVIKNVVVEENLADVGIRRFSQSARFYRITISGAITGIVPITQIDIQLQDRYNNKLR